MTPRQRINQAVAEATDRVIREIGRELRQEAGLPATADADLVWRFDHGRLIGQVGSGCPAEEVWHIIKVLSEVTGGSTPAVRRDVAASYLECYGHLDGLGIELWGVLEHNEAQREREPDGIDSEPWTCRDC